jgi:hypothetical protein
LKNNIILIRLWLYGSSKEIDHSLRQLPFFSSFAIHFLYHIVLSTVGCWADNSQKLLSSPEIERIVRNLRNLCSVNSIILFSLTKFVCMK